MFDANKLVTERNLALINDRMAKSRGRASMAGETKRKDGEEWAELIDGKPVKFRMFKGKKQQEVLE